MKCHIRVSSGSPLFAKLPLDPPLCPFCNLRGHRLKFLNLNIFLSVKIVLS